MTTPATTPTARGETLLLAGLTFAATAIAAVMLARGLTTWLEAVSFVTGALCVWLTVRESVWNFPVGMANVATFFVLFVQARLFADAGLQIVYFVLGGIGWYLWLFGGRGRTALTITPAPTSRRRGVAACVAVTGVGLYFLLRHLGGASPLWDAITTAICLGAQWLTDRKNWESWLLWITADLIYVPLYASKSLYLTAALYAVFLVMATVGLMRWRRVMRDGVRGMPA